LLSYSVRSETAPEFEEGTEYIFALRLLPGAAGGARPIGPGGAPAGGPRAVPGAAPGAEAGAVPGRARIGLKVAAPAEAIEGDPKPDPAAPLTPPEIPPAKKPAPGVLPGRPAIRIAGGAGGARYAALVIVPATPENRKIA